MIIATNKKKTLIPFLMYPIIRIREKGRFKNSPAIKPGAYFLGTIVDTQCGNIELIPIIPIKPR